MQTRRMRQRYIRGNAAKTLSLIRIRAVLLLLLLLSFIVNQMRISIRVASHSRQVSAETAAGF